MNILLDGLFYNGSGFAEDNRFLLKILHTLGHTIRIQARDKDNKGTVLSNEEEAFISSFETTPLVSNDIFITNIMGSFVRHNPHFKHTIARTMFETDRIPEFWKKELNQFHEIWVATSFNEKTFQNSGIARPLKVVPSGFELTNYRPEGEKLDLKTGKFVFLSIFDWQYRKGYDVLLKSFIQTFKKNENVALVIKSATGTAKRIYEYIEEINGVITDLPEIIVIEDKLSTDEMHDLYRSSDAFVLPTRGEGWGRPLFEAMLYEKPTIATNWSGHTEFMNKENAFLIPYELDMIKKHDIPFFVGHQWAEPSLEELNKTIRYIFENQEDAKKRGKIAREQLKKHYDFEAIQKIVDGLLKK